MKIFGGPFGQSSISPLIEHFLKVEKGAQVMLQFLTAYCDGDFKKAAELAAVVSKLEEEADAIKDETRSRISSSIFAAVERADVLMYLSTQDDIADHYNSIANLLRLRKTVVPQALRDVMLRLAQGSCNVVFELGGLLSAASGKTAGGKSDRFMMTIPKLEHKASETEEEFLQTLFANEHDLDPVSVMMLMRYAEEIMKMGKCARNACDILRRLTS